MVIFEGKSAKPGYLYINDDVAELRDAGHLWGQSVWKTEEALKTSLQDPLLRVSSIAKSGEVGVLYAAVVNDLHRAAGRSGVGAVMGSKNLKAIAVRGTKGVGNIKDPKAFMAATKAAKKVLADNGVTGTGLPAMGTQVLMSVINEVGALPTRNHQDSQFEGAMDIGAEAMAKPRATDGKKHLVTNQACFGCTIACGRISKMDEGHFTIENKPQYRGANGGLEYEAAWALGAANGVNDLECLQYANLLCNEEGIDPISFGATVGAVMELYGMGVLTKEQIGIEAPFGSARALAFLAEETVNGRGFGKEIGQGSKRLTAKYGHPELSMSSKGQEFPAYDGRAIQGIGLAYATSNRGGCHLRGYTIASEILGIPVKTDPLESQGKPELVKAFQDATAAFDSSGLCIFTTFAWGLQDLAPQISAACGDEYTIEELAKIGERIWNMEREFNNRAGFTKADDSLPPRLTSVEGACKTGPAKGKFNELATMLPLYYEARGWDPEGRPTAATKERLSL
jgi:aldehyde:ferredoxin oxidoreductase